MKKRLRRNRTSLYSKKLAKRMTSLVAMIVVFTTTYMMILPAIAIDRQAASGTPGMDIVTEQIPVLS